MLDRFPGYDVLAKRHTPSWNEVTRRVIDERLALPREPRFFNEGEWTTLVAVCDRIVPQPTYRAPVPVAAMVDEKMASNKTDGYRDSRLPKMQGAWRCILAALDAEAISQYRVCFCALKPAQQDALLGKMQRGTLTDATWGGVPCALLFASRVAHDIVAAYYSHPTAWNELGFGGPASPRGYVRMGFDRRDGWEAVEATAGHEDEARRGNARIG